MGTTQPKVRAGRGTRHGRLLAAGLALALTLSACADDGSETEGTLIDPIRPTTVPPRSDTTITGDDVGPGSDDGTDDGVGGGSGTGAGTGSGPGVGVPDDTESPLAE